MKVVKSRSGGHRYDTWYPEQLDEVSVDGVADFVMTANNCKITFFQVRGGWLSPEQDEERVEQRQAALVVSLPLPVAMEAFQNMLSGIAQNKAAILAASDARAGSIASMLEKMEFVAEPAPVKRPRLGQPAPAAEEDRPSLKAAPAAKKRSH